MLLKQHCFLLLLFLLAEAAQSDAPIAPPGCADTCGDVTIPYPFGIGSNCSLNSWFEINCNGSKPVLPKLGNVKVTSIAFPTKYIDITEQKLTVELPPLKVCTSNPQNQRLSSIDLRGSPYNFSAQDNVFVMEGCGGSAILVNQSNEIMAGCASICGNSSSMTHTNSCYGLRCCQTPLPIEEYGFVSPLQSYEIVFNGQSSGEGRNCLAATLVERHSVNKYAGKLSTSDSFTTPVMLLWNLVGSQTTENISPLASCSDPGYSSNIGRTRATELLKK